MSPYLHSCYKGLRRLTVPEWRDTQCCQSKARYSACRRRRLFPLTTALDGGLGRVALLRPTMLYTCPYCGRIHEKKYDCGRIPKRSGRRGSASLSEETAFRRSEAWKQMSLMIRNRDHYLCQVCVRGLYLYGSKRTLNYDSLSVHHIQPIAKAWSKRLDPQNLITLCSLHHEMAEAGEISVEEMQKIAVEQQNNASGGSVHPQNIPPGV